jgi:hypothetical protein
MAANNQLSPSRANIGSRQLSMAQHAARYGADAMEQYLFNALIVHKKDWEKIKKQNSEPGKKLFQ